MIPYHSAVLSLPPLTSIRMDDTQGLKLFHIKFTPFFRYKISLNTNLNILSSHQAYKRTEFETVHYSKPHI